MNIDGKKAETAICLTLGALGFAFTGWGRNMALAALAAPVFLMRFARGRKRWYGLAAAWPLLSLGAWLAIRGGWDMDPALVTAVSAVRPLLLLLPLGLDRLLSRRLGKYAGPLVFPSALIALEYGLSFTPFATVFSLGTSLYGLRELAQAASLAGIWGLGFLAAWLAPALNAIAENEGDFRKAGSAALVPLGVFCGILVYGAVRIGAAPAGATTVRVAGVSAEHPRDYWDLIDRGTPEEEVRALRPEARVLEDRLFADSARAAAAGARIVVWSEGACVLDEEREPAFEERAAAFARDSGVYLAAGVLTYRFGSRISDNKVLFYTPEGRRAFSYVKTISWYPTGSDGVLKAVDTPYGCIGAAICFDMDTPRFARRLRGLGADIVLVPAMDSERIRPFHTEVGLFRAVENGYSMFRQVALGTSMAVDGRGIVRGVQDYFAGPDRLFLADLPVRAERTLYAALGDWFAWLDLALLAGLLTLAGVLGFAKAARRGR